MITFDKQTWYNKNDIENASKRIPISAHHLNRLEEAVSATSNHTNDMTKHWWIVSKLTSREIYIPGLNSAGTTNEGDTINIVENSNKNETVIVYYSGEVSVETDKTTGLPYAKLVEPKSEEMYYSKYGSSGSSGVLKNKYYIIGNTNTLNGEKMYYCSTGVVSTNTNSTVTPTRYIVRVTKSHTTDIRNIYGDNEFVSSPNRNEYTDGLNEGGNLIYTYLGIPFENARKGVRIETGSYVGTGVYGSLYTNTLSFSGKPYLIFILGTEVITLTRGGDGNYSNDSHRTINTVWDENSITYYGKTTAWRDNYNAAGITYDYIAVVI